MDKYEGMYAAQLLENFIWKYDEGTKIATCPSCGIVYQGVEPIPGSGFSLEHYPFCSIVLIKNHFKNADSVNSYTIDGVHGSCLAEIPQVLDKGFVQLIDMMPHPATVDKESTASFAAVEAARTSFLGKLTDYNRDLALLEYLIEHEHTSTLEHIVFKFRIKAPVVVWWQLVRHRLASYNLQSGRYVEFDSEELYIPDVWRLQSEDNKQGSAGVLTGKESDIFSERVLGLYKYAGQMYNDAIDLGIAKEMARLLLPGFSVYYTGVITINARSLINVLKLRMDDHAQYEIRQYANALCDIVYLYIKEIISIYIVRGDLPDRG